MADALIISPTLRLEPGELTFSFIRSSGPGGQNVNKVSSAAQLRFDLRNSPSLPDAVAVRAAKLAGSRLTLDGVIVITADRFRTQVANRDDAAARLIELLQEAAIPPKPRRKTRPTLASRQKRLEGKAKRSGIKKLRQGQRGED